MKRNMAVVTSADHVSYQQSDIPELAPNQVLIKTSYASVCGSDLHLYHDVHPYVKAPCTIGHELAGRVVETGKQVKELKTGDLVAPEPVLVCGACEYCLGGNYHMCRNISFQYRKGQAGFTDYFVVDERWAHKVPESVGDKAAALLEPLSVAVHGAKKAGSLLGKTVVIYGAGAIGTLTALVCRLQGASKIWLVDRNDNKLKISARLTNAESINNMNCSPPTVIAEATGGIGCDAAIECTGHEACAAEALECVRKMGTVVQMGISSGNFTNYPYSKILQKEIRLQGSQGYCFDFQTSLALLNTGNVDLSSFITHDFSWEDIEKAFELAANPQTDSMKIVLKYS